MSKITLKTSMGDSEIIVQRDGLDEVNRWMTKNHPKSNMIIITDTNIGDLYRSKLEQYFPKAIVLAVVASETSKRLAVVKQLAGEMLDEGITRADVVVGFGGGMITDLAGFVASIYMRGMPYIAIPTSIVGMVDAAIGGKTGVNLEAKNILGTFYPAELVLIDSNFLDGAPDVAVRCGMAESIKYAATLDANLADDLMKEKPDIDEIITKSVKAKADIVSQDLREGGLRKVLNFGHTFGHAIEQMSEYKLSHGEAISIGMVLANKVAQKLGKQTKETGDKIRDLLKKYNLPTEMPKDMTVENLVDLMKKDKKRTGDKITYVIAPEMGKYEMMEMKPEELVELAK
jgi:3-dehydroquinate synthase